MKEVSFRCDVIDDNVFPFQQTPTFTPFRRNVKFDVEFEAVPIKAIPLAFTSDPNWGMLARRGWFEISAVDACALRQESARRKSEKEKARRNKAKSSPIHSSTQGSSADSSSSTQPTTNHTRSLASQRKFVAKVVRRSRPSSCSSSCVPQIHTIEDE